MLNNYTISAAILTYSDRREYLIPAISSLLERNFSKIYVFCNGLSKDVFDSLNYRFEGQPVDFIISEKNLGSAGGYYQLLKYIAENDDSDYVLLLDDDNSFESDGKFSYLDGSDTLFYVNRPSRKAVVATMASGNAAKILGPKSGFLGRSIFPSLYEDVCGDTDLLAAPYGGLILPRKVFDLGIFPDVSYFLYADDYAYSYSLVVKHGFKIKFVDSDRVVDLESSFHLDKKRRLLQNRYMGANDIQLYYSVRNQIHFILSTCSNKPLFYINVILFYPVFSAQFILNGAFSKFKLFSSAVKDGFSMYFRSRGQEPK
ncbi:glycosyltransferase family 2 protein [Shewanella algae]|uniref:glycosyltransferase family 2 protein n=1 Tax=Shewanella algae TaxID=38313 RepID=UPI001655490C|nr:glycosyltransferase family 2 protein [Shewanella algae]MBC8796426.1 glycosyltransferase family 2 protein [Shewanella algae]